jgi:hypothetical protein
MKRSLLPALILLLTLPVSAQEAFSKYIAIEDYTGLSVVKVSTVEDFIDLAKRSRTSSAFIKWKGGAETSTILISIDSVFYSFELDGYKTIADYHKGTKAGYRNGAAYYEAVKLGITQLDFYVYYKRNDFASMEDAKKAYAAGFIIEDMGKARVVLPAQLSADKMKQLAEAVPPTAYKLEGTVYTLVHPGRRLTEDYAGDAASARFKPKEIKESHLYYFSVLNGIANYKDYLPFSESIKAGYLSVADSADSKKKGFESAPTYYDAKTNGFTSAADFQEARSFSIKTFDEYKAVKDWNTQVAAIVKKDGKNYSDAAMTYVLTSLPKGKLYQISMIVDYIDDTFMRSSAVKNHLKKQGFVNGEAMVKEFLARNRIIADGKFDLDSGVFQK